MAMNGDDRGDADMAAVLALNPNSDKLSPAELDEMRAYFRGLYTADTGYITGNADVLPTALSGSDLEAASAIPGTVTSGPGSGGNTITNAPGPLEGKGSLQ